MLKMYSLIKIYESAPKLKDEVLDTFKKNIQDAGLPIEYMGFDMVIKKEYAEPLITTVTEYMYKVVGFTFGNLAKDNGDIVPFVTNTFVNPSELNKVEHAMIMLHQFQGFEIPGFYTPYNNTINVRIGCHLKKVLHTLFHELTHAYLCQNHIKFKDTWNEKKITVSAFKDQMHNANQCEGFCEMITTIMFYHLFKKEEYSTSVTEYWLGWRLCMQAFTHFSNKLLEMCSDKSLNYITQLSIDSIINMIKRNGNLYKFVPMVPSDTYRRRRKREI